jgi:uncharacterized cupredoxin-like copper-binding protein
MNRSALIAAAAATFLAAGCAGKINALTPTSDSAGIAGDAVEVHANQLPSDHAFTIDNTSAKAGNVTFTLVNDAKEQHELIVLKTDTPFDQLEVGKDFRVSEDASIGEISETDAGKTATQTFDLAPGNYVLVCNIPLHYGQGMRLAFTVKG